MTGFAIAAIRWTSATLGATSDMSEHQVERPGHLAEIERLDEQARVADLPPAAAAHEAPKLLLGGPALPRRLLLEGAEGSELSLGVDDLFHGGGAESADQLVLQICDAHVETQPLHLGASEVGAEAGPLETAPEVALLCGVVETRQPDVEPLRPEPLQELSDRLRTADRHDGNALGVEIPAAALGERLDRALVADPFDEHDRMLLPVHPRILHLVADSCSAQRALRAGLTYPRAGIAWTAQPLPSGSLKKRNEPHGNSWTSPTSTPRETSSARAA